jgi:hypothetical protein
MSQLDLRNVREKFEKFFIALGATYITHTRMKIVGGKETKIPCITIGFPKKVEPAALMTESEFWKLFEEFQKGKLPGPESRTRVVDSLGHSLEVAPVMIPKILDGMYTDIIERSIIDIPKPVSGPAEHMKKYRPVPGGVSFIACGSSACSSHLWVRGDPKHKAHKDCLNSEWYGTIELAGRKYTGCWHLGSNYHCAMQFNKDGSPYPAGHGWAQPSPMDGGICPTDVVSYRHSFIIAVQPNQQNEFDYMLTNAADLRYVSADVLDFGGISVVYFEPKLGWECWSSSRTEGTTSGKILATEVTIGVNYQFFIAYIRHCIEHSAKISGGSSGSSFLARPTGEAIGLAGINFAGSATQNYAIALPAIARDYGVEFDWAAHPDGEQPECPPGQHWDPTQGKCVPDQPECPPGQHWDPDQGKCVPDEPPKDCYSQFLDCLMGWDGSDLDYLLNCLMGLVICLVTQGTSLTKRQKKQILSLISVKIGKTKAMEIMQSAGIGFEERDYRGLFALGTLLGCGIFGALSVWFPNALPIFTFFGGLAAREIEHYFSAKSREQKA